MLGRCLVTMTVTFSSKLVTMSSNFLPDWLVVTRQWYHSNMNIMFNSKCLWWLLCIVECNWHYIHERRALLGSIFKYDNNPLRHVPHHRQLCRPKKRCTNKRFRLLQQDSTTSIRYRTVQRPVNLFPVESLQRSGNVWYCSSSKSWWLTLYRCTVVLVW